MGEERPSIFAEMSRRKVFRVAAVYAGAAWAILQVSDIVFPRLGLPDWTVTLVLALCAIGFPIALICAWAFVLTPDGLKRDDEASPGEGVSVSPFRVVEVALILGLVCAVGYLYATRLGPGSLRDAGARTPEVAAGTKFASPSLVPEARPPSIAVLPFVNMSQDADNEYFSDGVSEEILDALAKLGRLRVAARTSSFSFKGDNMDVRKIGEQLGVETILEGSVRKAGNQVRITAQLIDTENGYHRWSETYDRELTHIFDVQDEIARAIVDALQVPLGLSKEQDLVQTGTQNVEAYNLYLRGLHHFQNIGPESFDKTIEYMRRASALDPDYAAPHGLMASAWLISSLWLPMEVAFPKARAAYERALALDPDMGIALTTKAQYVTLTEWDWETAREAYDRALEDPTEETLTAISYATLHLIPLGEIGRAEEILAEAEERDPLDNRLKIVKGMLALFVGNTFEAIRLNKLALDIDGNSIQAAAALCGAYAARLDARATQELVAEWKAKLGYDHPWLFACQGQSALRLGDRETAQKFYGRISAAAKRQPGLAFFAGDLALALRQIDDAVEWYAQSLAQGELGMLMTRLRHAREPELQAHPGYQALVSRMHLDDASLARIGRSISGPNRL